MDNELICSCFDVYKDDIVKAIKEKDLDNLQEVMDETDAGNGCGSCHDRIQEILNELL